MLSMTSKNRTLLGKIYSSLYSPLYSSLSIVFLMLLCSACSIKDETSDEIKVTKEEQVNEATLNDTDKFILECKKCILGDLSNLPHIIELYKSSYTASLEYKEDSFKYQYQNTVQAFEKCAQKAMLMGDKSAFNAMDIKQARIARIARYFYATNQLTEGAYWLRRLINVRGAFNGYEVAGRVFIQNPQTINIGVQLLEYAARLGNRNASQMLLGLMNPGSLYYHQLTRNAPISTPKLNDDIQEDTDQAKNVDKNVDKKEQDSEQASTIVDFSNSTISTDLLQDKGSAQAINSTNPELNIPLELYEKPQVEKKEQGTKEAAMPISNEEIEKRSAVLKEVQARADAAVEEARKRVSRLQEQNKKSTQEQSTATQK